MIKCKHCRESIRSDKVLNIWVHTSSALRACVGNTNQAWPKECPGYWEDCGVPIKTDEDDLCSDCSTARLHGDSPRVPR